MEFLRVLWSTNVMRLFFLLFIVFFQLNAFSQEWDLVKDSEGIQVYTRKTEAMDYKAFKSEAIIDADIQAFVALIQNVAGLHEWGYKLESSKLLERKGDTLQIYFAEAKAPFPYRNRYGIYLNEFKWYSQLKELYVSIELLENHDFDGDDLVMLKGSGYWKVVQLETGQLKVVFEMQVDPGKGIPAWLSNLFADESPYETMLAVKTELKKGKYQGKQYQFLID